MKIPILVCVAFAMFACGDTASQTSTDATVAPAEDMSVEPGNPCAANPCANAGMCVESEDGQGASCRCSGTGFEGPFCNEDIDECDAGTATCTQNSICTNTEGGYDCPCDTGYSANAESGTCDDINECVEGTATCTQNSTCANTEGGYDCPCDTGYSANADDGTCDDINECEAGTATCTQNSTCANTEGGYDCPCDTGYSANAESGTCDDINECVEGTATCTQNSTCANTEGGYDCLCDTGYSANAEDGTCADIDECESGTATCTPNSTCTNTEGGYDCLCDTGYSANAESGTCDDIDECESGSATCTQNSTCANTEGGYDCPCDTGYGANAESGTCDDINECDAGTATCTQNSICINTEGGYDCLCDTGYSANADDGTCDDINECETNSIECPQDLHCVNTTGGYDCVCAPIGTPPIIEIVTPTRGELIEGAPGQGAVALSATVSDSGIGLASLTLNGHLVEVIEGALDIELDEALDTKWGLNTVVITAQDVCGNTSDFVSSFLHSEDYFPLLASPDVSASHDSMTLRVGQALIDDGDRADFDDLATFAQASAQSLDLNASVPDIIGVDPDANGDGRIDSRTYDCVFWTETNQRTGYKITKNGVLTYLSPNINYLRILPETDSLELTMSVRNINLPIRVQGHLDTACLGETNISTFGDVLISNVSIVVSYEVALDDNEVSLTRKAITYDFNGLYIDVDFGSLDVVDFLVNPIINAIVGVTESSIAGEVSNLVDSEITPVAEGFLQGVGFGPLGPNCSGGCELDFELALNELNVVQGQSFSENGIGFGFFSHAYPPEFAPWFPAESTLGSIRHVSAEASPQDTDSDFAATLEDNLFNQMFWSVWAQGALEFTEEMTTAWLPEDGATYALTLSHLLPPVFMPTDLATGLQIGFGDIHLKGTKAGVDGSDPTQIDLFVTVLAPGFVEGAEREGAEGSSLNCTLAEQAQWAVNWAPTGDHNLGVEQTDELLGMVLGTALADTLTKLCSAVPLPVIDLGGLTGLPSAAMLTVDNPSITRLEQAFELSGTMESPDAP